MNTKREFNLLRTAAINKPIHSITKFTTLDYPKHLACIFWFAKCNMACPYCYNPHIVKGNGILSIDEALSFLKNRIGRLDSVVLSGGECTLYPHLEELCKNIKALGYKIKIDTNGTNPPLLKTLIDNSLIDYIALDYKAPSYKFQTMTQNRDFESFSVTLDYLIGNHFPFEVRTTLHNELLDFNDIEAIMRDLHKRGYTNTYYLQNYLHVEETLGNTKKQQSKFDFGLLSSTLPIELRNF